MKELEYPFDARYLIKKKKSLGLWRGGKHDA